MTLRLNSVEYQNHSIVYADDINTYYDSDSTALQCRTDNPDCCSSSTGGYWYLPSGSTVLTEYLYDYYNWHYNGYVYQSRGGSSQQWAAVYLHRTSSLVTEGLYRCEIPTSGTHGNIEVAYVGVYWQTSSSGKLAIHAPVLPISSRYNCVKLPLTRYPNHQCGPTVHTRCGGHRPTR